MRGGEVYPGCWWGELRVRNQLEDLGIDGKILKLIFKKWDLGADMDWIDLA
jgi:hypothetical protein